MTKVIGIGQRISASLIEESLRAAFNGEYNKDFAASLVENEFNSEVRKKKAIITLGKIIEKNPIYSFITKHKEKVLEALHYKDDKAIIITSLVNSAFPFCYDEVNILGKYFHVQDRVSRMLLCNKLSEIYSFNKSLSNTIDYTIPTLIEAGLITRPEPGVYKKVSLELSTSISKEIYLESFFINNPLIKQSNFNYEDAAYFEFLR